MIGTDLVSFAALVGVAICYGVGFLAWWQLYVAVFVGGLCSVIYNVCDSVMFVSVIKPPQYVDGQSLFFGSIAIAGLLGPAIGGLLVQMLTAPLAILVDAASFLFSAFVLGRLKVSEPPSARTTAEKGIMTGFRLIRDTDAIRSTLSVAAGVNLFNSLFYALFALLLINELHASPGLIGSLLATGAVGGLAGAAATRKLVHVIGEGWTLLFASVMISAPLIVVPLTRQLTAATLALLVAGFIGSALGRTIQNITIGSIFAHVVPDALRSRTRGAFQMVSFGMRPLGSLLGGVLGTVFDVRSALLIGVIGGALMFVWLLPSRLLRSRIVPRRPDAETVDDHA
jgi:MFS family permease